MSTATLVVDLAAAPVSTTVDNIEMVEVYASIKSGDAILPVLVRASAASSAAKSLLNAKPNDTALLSGQLSLDDSGNTPLIFAWAYCPATPEQYFNAISLVGRLSGENKLSDKGISCRRSVAVNRFFGGKEHTDWYKIRGYGKRMDQLHNLEKGSLVSVDGVFELRRNRDNDVYFEVKVRHCQPHGRGKSPGGDMAAGTQAAGFDHADFTGINDMPLDWGDNNSTRT